MSPQPEPAVGRAIPEGIVPRDPYIAHSIIDAVDQWWHGLTPEQRVGLWTQYGWPNEPTT